MNVVTLLQPPRMVLGNGCAPQCADYLAQRGVRRVLLVSSTPALPTLRTVRDALQTANLTVVNATPVDCEPTCALFEQLLVTARTENIEAVLGIGGGSATDVAKLLAALTRGTQTVAEVFGINLLAGRALPLVGLPTTSGTGAEVSPNAILLDEAAALKKGVVSPHLVPDAAFSERLLTRTAPPPVTAASHSPGRPIRTTTAGTCTGRPALPRSSGSPSARWHCFGRPSIGAAPTASCSTATWTSSTLRGYAPFEELLAPKG